MIYTRIAFVLGLLVTVGLAAVTIAQISVNGIGSAGIFLLALASFAMVGMIALGTVVGGRGKPAEFPTAPPSQGESGSSTEEPREQLE